MITEESMKTFYTYCIVEGLMSERDKELRDSDPEWANVLRPVGDTIFDWHERKRHIRSLGAE
jgi:hypothetical protein